MKAYKYNENSKIFENEVDCQIDQLESKITGKNVFLLPQYCTFKKPLEQKDGCDVCFDVAAEKWVYVEREEDEEVLPHEPTTEEQKQIRVDELKDLLNATDYKIIKCSECSLAGEPLPYDIKALHEERQTIRDEINEIEND